MDRDPQHRIASHSNVFSTETRMKAETSTDSKRSLTEGISRNNSGTDTSDTSLHDSASAEISKGTKRSFDNTQATSGGVPGAERDDDELSIPRASLNKMIKELAPNVRVANDARELILSCCTEFIHLISSEANDLCNKQQKKTISPEHVLGALDSLGFGSYKDEACAVLQEAKAVAAKKRRASSKLENLGIPEEELLRQQQELFAKARLEQANIEHQEWLRVQQQLQQQQLQQQQQSVTTQDDDYN